MASKKHGRSVARASALAILYSSDITERNAVRVVEDGSYPADVELSDYAEQLITGVHDHQKSIDEQLEATSENWAIDRMPAVDRAVLRLAVYEMMYVDDVPISVTINEAVELAKQYGSEDDSARFVNGVLGRIARQLEENASAPTSEEAPKSADADDA